MRDMAAVVSLETDPKQNSYPQNTIFLENHKYDGDEEDTFLVDIAPVIIGNKEIDI